MALSPRRAAATRLSSPSGRSRLISAIVVTMVELASSRMDLDTEGSLSTNTSSVSAMTPRDTRSSGLPSFSILAIDATKCVACIDLMHSESATRAACTISKKFPCASAISGIFWELEISNSAETSLLKPAMSVSGEDQQTYGVQLTRDLTENRREGSIRFSNNQER